MSESGLAIGKSHAGQAPKRGRSALSLRHAPSMRSQVLGTVLLINLVAAIAAVFGILCNARARTEREMTASVALAERYVRESVERMSVEARGAPLEAWPVQEHNQRHVHIRVEHGDGRTTNLVSPPMRSEDAAPEWFTALVGAREIEREVPIVLKGKPAGRIVIIGTPSDEVAEVWEDVRDFLLIATGVDLAVLLALYFALGRVLAQLRCVAVGLGELEEGRFRYRMVPPAGRELVMLTERFNSLAGALDVAREDNARLNRELVSTQDDERRQIAADLHDELGPCLFGLKANAGSLERLVSDATTPVATRMQARIATIVEIIERMQTVNRRLLQKLRPVALDHVPLADALTGLVAEFERHAPEQRFDLDLGLLAPRYGDSIDVTLYRCIQEGVTNALKHGACRTVRIQVREVSDADGRRLCLRIEDDGQGLPSEPALGMGLVGMKERVRALGGHWSIAAAVDKGVCVAVDIPVATDVRTRDDPPRDKRGL